MSSGTHSRQGRAIPPLLEPIVRLPKEKTLLLLTGVLGATPHWIVSRFLKSVLSDDRHDNGDDDREQTAVVLVSWMRDLEYWKAEARRGAGIDLESLMQKNRFSFVDGLSDLFSSPSIPDARPKDIPVRTLNPPSAPTPRGPLPSRTAVDGRPADLRSPIRNNPPPASPVQSGVNTSNESAPRSRKGFWSLTSPSLPHAVTQITKAITSLTLSQKRVFLILDAPTVLLAATPTTSTELSSFILQLREQVHSTLLVLEADAPLLYAAAPDAFSFDHAGDMENRSRITPTPMEAEHAAFVSGQAHVARSVIGCRRLDTGAAKDVSGVLSVRRGGDWDDGEGIVEEMEVLYHVQTDGGVTVFQRGAGNAG